MVACISVSVDFVVLSSWCRRGSSWSRGSRRRGWSRVGFSSERPRRWREGCDGLLPLPRAKSRRRRICLSLELERSRSLRRSRSRDLDLLRLRPLDLLRLSLRPRGLRLVERPNMVSSTVSLAVSAASFSINFVRSASL